MHRDTIRRGRRLVADRRCGGGDAGRIMGWRKAGVIVVCVGCAWPTARAATSEPVSSSMGAMERSGLRFGSVTLHSENDFYLAGTDRRYTNGFKLSVLSTDLRHFGDAPLPGPVQNVARRLDRLIDKNAVSKVGFSIGQNIYTPSNIQTTAYQPDDRPYAAWLYLGAAFHNYLPEFPRDDGTYRPARLELFELNIGVVGPKALGEWVQNGWHRVIDVAPARGWDNQIRDEVGFNLIYERKLRYPLAGSSDGWSADVSPHFGASLGNVATYANAGAEVRLGYRLPAGFSSGMIRATGEIDAPRMQSFHFYVFAMTDARAVGRDITLDGNTWRDSPSIDKEPFVADFAGGFSIGLRYVQLTYTQVVRTHEFRGQQGNQVFGSISLTCFF